MTFSKTQVPLYTGLNDEYFQNGFDCDLFLELRAQSENPTNRLTDLFAKECQTVPKKAFY